MALRRRQERYRTPPADQDDGDDGDAGGSADALYDTECSAAMRGFAVVEAGGREREHGKGGGGSEALSELPEQQEDLVSGG